eukprot:4461030-Alexandrium_andersonii.AAC.1
MWVIPSVARLLQEAEDLPAGSNPLEGTTKLQAVVSKARTADKIQLVVESIMDSQRAGFLPQPPPLAAYMGTLPGSGGKGLVDLIIYKFDVSHYILHEWVVSHAFPAEQLVEMKRVFTSISDYRKQCGYANSKKGADVTFRAGWRPSCEELFVLIESVLFDTMYDSYFKDALRNNSQPADCVANYMHEFMGPIADLADRDKDTRGGGVQRVVVSFPCGVIL